MDTKDLEEQVRCIIETTYECKYIDKLEIQNIFDDSNEHIGYSINIYLGKPETPINLTYMGNELQFLEFIKKEIKKNRYNFVDYFNAERIYFSVGCCEELK